MNDIKDMNLAPSGEKKIEWAARNMPLLNKLMAEFTETRPFAGLKIALSVHMEAKTAFLCRVLRAGGAEMHATGCNPLSTQDDVAAALAKSGVNVCARHAASPEQYTRHLKETLACGPDIIIDDGGDLIGLLHTEMRDLLPGIMGGCEETTTGIKRLRAMQRDGALAFPMISVNDAECKYLFDNRYGTGQSVWDGINRTTNLIVAGKNVVIAGYGWCGKGIAMRARGFGARVTVCEINPVRALEAVMDGFELMTMSEASAAGDLFITATGCRDVITREHFLKMRDGAILCNAGHFNVEIDMDYLDGLQEKRPRKENIMGYQLDNGRTIFVLAEGRLVNLASGDGHPAEIMDMSFAIQALSAEYLASNHEKLERGVIPVPDEINLRVANMKLEALGRNIDTLTAKQATYLNSWNV
jgi:adenosylhomocysteinase